MPDRVELDILSIAAHPDDMEITCGGLLIKMAKLGRKVGGLDLTQGEMGTYGDENDRTAESAEASRIMGLVSREQLDIPDSAIAFTQENKLKIAEVIRATRPEMVILPHWTQRHPDHLEASRLGYAACFLAGLKKLPIDGEPYRPRKIIYASYYRDREYSFMVETSEEFEQKCEAVLAYKSQFSDEAASKRIFSPGFDVVEMMRTRDKYIGSLVGTTYGEAYTIKEHILINDPQSMPVQSV